MIPRPLLAAALLTLTACTNMDALHRSESEVPNEALVAAAESESAADSAALVLLADLAAHYPGHAPTQETLATVLEALGTRARSGTLPPAHAGVAGELAGSLALDDVLDASVRMNACELLGALGRTDVLEQVAADALDPLVSEQAEEVLARLAGE